MTTHYELLSKTLNYYRTTGGNISFTHYMQLPDPQYAPTHPSLNATVTVSGAIPSGSTYYGGFLFQSGSDRSTAVFIQNGTQLKYTKASNITRLSFDLTSGNSAVIDKTNLQTILDLASAGSVVGTDNIANINFNYYYDGVLQGNYALNASKSLQQPFKVGYTSDGIYRNANFLGTAVTSIPQWSSGYKYFYLKYTLVQYNINYVLNGGTNNSSNPATYNTEQHITFNNPTRTQYTFDGWWIAQTGGSQVYAISPGATGIITVYARWTPITYTITYNLDGGTNSSGNPATYTVEEPWIALEFATKSGYTFIGWFDAASGGNEIMDIDTGNGEGYVLYARWSIINYNITYNLDEGTNSSSNPATYNVTTSTITLATPTKSGYTFNGWFTASSGGTQVTQIAVGSTGNKDLYARWTLATYTITYNGWGEGTHSNPATYTITTATITLGNASHTGYTFLGWFTANVGGTQVTTIPLGSTGNKTVYSRWAIIDYDIYYNLDGGTNHASNPATYNIATATITFVSPTKTGYTFGGWFTDVGLTTSITNIPAGSIGAKTLYAKWTIITYTIIYGLDGGTNSGSNPSTYNVTTPNITLSNATKSGYTFTGWYDAQSGGNKITTITTSAGGNKTLYARWSLDSYGITYNNLQGATNTNPATYNVTTATITLSSLSRPGYTFNGWFTASSGGTQVTQIAQGSTGAKTFYARWTIIVYNINYNFNNGTVPSGIPTTYTIESAEIILTTNTTRLGYTWGGWFTNAGLTNPITKINAGSTGTVNVYAKWTLDVYNITYNNLQNGTHSNVATYSVTTPTITLTNATRTGYTFDGWFTASSGGTQVTQILLGSTGHKILYARWTIITYTLSYTLSGGTNNVSNPATYNVETATITFGNPTRVGYTFVEWRNNNVNGSVITSVVKGSIGNKIVFAVWIPIPYTITYTPKGDVPTTTINHSNITSYNIESNNYTLKIASAEGYEFGGWYTNQSLTEASKITVLTLTGQTGNKTVYGKWTIKSGMVNLINKYIKSDLSEYSDTLVSGSFDYGQTISISFTPPTKVKGTYWNYKFVGWTKNAASTSVDTFESFDVNSNVPFTNGTMDADLTKAGNYYAVYQRERKGLKKGAGNLVKIMSGTKKVIKIYKGTQIIYEKRFEN